MHTGPNLRAINSSAPQLPDPQHLDDECYDMTGLVGADYAESISVYDFESFINGRAESMENIFIGDIDLDSLPSPDTVRHVDISEISGADDDVWNPESTEIITGLEGQLTRVPDTSTTQSSHTCASGPSSQSTRQREKRASLSGGRPQSSKFTQAGTRQDSSAIASSHSEMRCMRLALSVSYKSHFCFRPSLCATQVTLFTLLNRFRQCVHALGALVSCTHCSTAVSFTALLTDIYARLARGFVNIASMSAHVVVQAQGQREELIRGYTVDTREEFIALFGVIAAGNLGALRQVAARIRSHAKAKCKVVLYVLQQSDKRLAGIERLLRPVATDENSSFLDPDLEMTSPE